MNSISYWCNPLINRSIYSIEATSKSCLQLFIAVFLFCVEKAKIIEPYQETCFIFMDPVRDLFPFYMRMVQPQTDAKVRPVSKVVLLPY